MNASASSSQTGIIAWFATNRVAANLLMLFLIGMGLASAFTIRKQTTPDAAINTIEVQVPYPGAAPQEVEEGVVARVEEAIQDVEGVQQIISISAEGQGTVSAEVGEGHDLDTVLNDIKTRVDAIATFPTQIERPIISKRQQTFPVVFLAIHGELDEHARKDLALKIRDEVLRLPEVTQVDLLGDREYEISIEVSESALRTYDLTLSEVAQAIQESSTDLPGGTIRSSGGDIRLRSLGQAYTGEEFGRLVLRTAPDGTRLLLADVATIRDGFVEPEAVGRFDGEPTITLRILASGQQNELATAAAVRTYVDERAQRLPEGAAIDVWIDRSYYLKDRLQMMNRNMLQGAVLVLVVLTLFLRLHIAWWVIVGLPVTFFGALWLMPLSPISVTINTVSLFGFIIVLGIVVDDAIIIGESIHSRVLARGHTTDNVIAGAKRVAMPATFGVLTTIAAFAPLLFIGGVFGSFFEALSIVVILCLLISLVESKLILPSHLARGGAVSKVKRTSPQFLTTAQRFVDRKLNALINHHYRPMLQRVVSNRGLTAAVFVAAFVLTIGVISAGIVRVVVVPEVPSDFIQVKLEMNAGTPSAKRDEVALALERTVLEMNEQHLAAHPDSLPMIAHVGVFSTSKTGALLLVEMPLDSGRPYEGMEISDMWRERVGEIPGVKELTFSGADPISGEPPLGFRLTGQDLVALEQAAAELAAVLGSFEGVHEVRSSLSRGEQELELRIKPEAQLLGLTQSALGRQVRQAFYGEEAQRIQRGNSEVRVMVRYPADERRSVRNLKDMYITTPQGDAVPFSAVADVEHGQGFTSIRRVDRLRTVTVWANADTTIVTPSEVVAIITGEVVPDLLARYPNVNFALDGTSQDEAELIKKLAFAAAVALFMIYALIAIPLKSYSQPLIIMAVIPLGLIGAVIGHLLLGQPLSMFSFFGIIALAGVLVNDSLILIDFVNRARAAGVTALDAVLASGPKRFRAIVLTSLTTTAGLVPIIMETSVQAQFVIPMAISVSFGIMFATLITLFLIPALYLLQIDLKRSLRGTAVTGDDVSLPARGI